MLLAVPSSPIAGRRRHAALATRAAAAVPSALCTQPRLGAGSPRCPALPSASRVRSRGALRVSAVAVERLPWLPRPAISVAYKLLGTASIAMALPALAAAPELIKTAFAVGPATPETVPAIAVASHLMKMLGAALVPLGTALWAVGLDGVEGNTRSFLELSLAFFSMWGFALHRALLLATPALVASPRVFRGHMAALAVMFVLSLISVYKDVGLPPVRTA